MDSKRESVLVTQCTWNSCLRSQSWSQQGGRTEKLRFLKLNVSWTFLNKANPEVLIAQTCILGDGTNSYFIRNLWGRFWKGPGFQPAAKCSVAHPQGPVNPDSPRPPATDSCEAQLSSLSSPLSQLRLRLLCWNLLPLTALSEWQNAFFAGLHQVLWEHSKQSRAASWLHIAQSQAKVPSWGLSAGRHNWSRAAPGRCVGLTLLHQ